MHARQTLSQLTHIPGAPSILHGLHSAVVTHLSLSLVTTQVPQGRESSMFYELPGLFPVPRTAEQWAGLRPCVLSECGPGIPFHADDTKARSS